MASTTTTSGEVAVITLSDDVETRLAVQTELRSLHTPREEMMECFHAWMTLIAINDDVVLRAAYPEIPRVGGEA